MIATYHGQAFIKAQQGEKIFAFNPIGRDFDPKAAKFGADVALLSLRDPAFSGVDTVTFGTKEPFVIDSPGEYELDGVFIHAFSSAGPDGKINTIYTMTLDGIRLCHLGGLASAQLTPEVTEEIGVVDVLFVPAAPNRFLSPKEAMKLAAAVEAKIIVPTLYDQTSLKAFLKEAGEEKENAVDKLTLKRKDLEGQEGAIVVLQA